MVSQKLLRLEVSQTSGEPKARMLGGLSEPCSEFSGDLKLPKAHNTTIILKYQLFLYSV
jgi:hypothetical protein